MEGIRLPVRFFFLILSLKTREATIPADHATEFPFHGDAAIVAGTHDGERRSWWNYFFEVRGSFGDNPWPGEHLAAVRQHGAGGPDAGPKIYLMMELMLSCLKEDRSGMRLTASSLWRGFRRTTAEIHISLSPL